MNVNSNGWCIIDCVFFCSCCVGVGSDMRGFVKYGWADGGMFFISGRWLMNVKQGKGSINILQG